MGLSASSFVNKNGRLPYLLRWLETHDNPIDGDKWHLERWNNFVAKYGKFGIYCRRVGWLWRNKGYSYSYYISGRKINPPYTCYGNPDTESGNNYVVGYNLVLADNAWCYFAMLPFFKIGKYQIFWRIYLGWKIKRRTGNSNKSGRAMLAIFIGFRTKVIK